MTFSYLFGPSPPAWAIVWAAVLLLISVIWLLRHRKLNRAGRDPVIGPHLLRDPAAPLPPLSIVVAAKDEEANIERCVRSLLAQNYPDLQMIAVNDRSSDRTGQILDDLAAQDPRLRVLHVRELPAGWGGKIHAMSEGVTLATGEYLFFTDADCTFVDQDLLATAVRFSRQEQIGVLSVLPRLETGAFWESIIQPPAGAILLLWFPPEKVNDPATPVAYANGAFILASRAAYMAMGGHAQMRGYFSEDMEFARRTKRKGLRLRVIRGGNAFSVRMYTRLVDTWRGWTRIFFNCFRTWGKLSASAGLVAFSSLFPVISLVAGLVVPGVPRMVALAAGVTLIAQQSVLWRFYRLCSVAAPWALTYPLGATFCVLATINAMRRLAGAKIHWRGTEYTYPKANRPEPLPPNEQAAP